MSRRPYKKDCSINIDDLRRVLASAESLHDLVSNTLVAYQLDDLKLLLGHVEAHWQVLVKQIASNRETLAPNFNLFRILRVGDLEATHSNMLAALLDPMGPHGQGSLFLTEFLNILQHAPVAGNVRYNFPPADASWQVCREDARVDVTLGYAGRFLVLVENKWGHEEYYGQLRTYWRDRRSLYPDDVTIVPVFLTLHGDPPSGLDDANYHPISISWLEDIRPVIEGMGSSIKAQRVRETVAQYFDLLASKREELLPNEA